VTCMPTSSSSAVRVHRSGIRDIVVTHGAMSGPAMALNALNSSERSGLLEGPDRLAELAHGWCTASARMGSTNSVVMG
jgi:hypothetical protein